MGDSALPGLRSEFLNRRSFLFGSAVSLGALGLAGCATTDDMARAAKLYGPCPTRNSRYQRSTSARSIRNIIAGPCATTPVKRPARSSSIRPVTMFTASKTTETPPLWRQCPPKGSCGPARLTSAQGGMGDLDPPKEMIQRQPEARKYAGGMPEVSTIRSAPAHSIFIKRRVHGVHDLQHQRPRIDRDRRYERLHRPPHSGHARPLFTHADQDEVILLPA